MSTAVVVDIASVTGRCSVTADPIGRRTEEQPTERTNKERHGEQSKCRNGARGFAQPRKEDLLRLVEVGIYTETYSVTLPIAAVPIALRITLAR